METKEVPLTSASMHATVELVLAERASGEATLERAFASILSFIAGTVGMEEGADESLLRVKKGFEPRYREREEEGRQSESTAVAFCKWTEDDCLSNRKSASGFLFGEADAGRSNHVVAWDRLDGRKGRPEGVTVKRSARSNAIGRNARSCARDGRLTQSRALGWQRVYAHTLAGPT